MTGALFTTVFFSLSAIFARRSIAAVGPTRANLGRLGVAIVLLGLYAHTLGSGLRGAGLAWFLLSGVIGMGLGDLALYATLPLLGSRLSVLMMQCVAVPLAMLAEWLWLGTRLAPAQLLWATVILAGIALALMPSPADPPKVRLRPLGFLWGFLAAAGQGLGAVVSRRGYEAAALHAESIDGITAAYQRIAGGLVVALLFVALRPLLRSSAVAPAVSATDPAAADTPFRLHPRRWILLNALCGPVLGVSCYQWSLATTPSGIVLPIVACTPLVIVPLSFWLDRERPSRRSLLGGLLAVAGVIALTLVRTDT